MEPAETVPAGMGPARLFSEGSGPAKRLWQDLTDLGLAPEHAGLLLSLAQACATVTSTTSPITADGTTGPITDNGTVPEAPAVKARAAALTSAVASLTGATGKLDEVMIAATTQLTLAEGKLLLADKGLTSTEGLAPSVVDAWRARAKSNTRTELELATGLAPGEIRHLVSLATMPTTVQAPVTSALSTGEASWRLVRGFLSAAGHLPTDLTAGVATTLFGPDPTTAATERLTSTRELTGDPWRHKEFYRALDREIAKAEADLPEEDRKATSRARALDDADAWGRLDENGTGLFGLRCTATQLAGITERLEAAARRARANGDQRRLGQLRSAIATTLLLQGTVTIPDLPDDPATLTPEQTEQLAAILHALPPAVLNVIVPLNHLQPTGPDGERRADSSSGAADERVTGQVTNGGEQLNLPDLRPGHTPGSNHAPPSSHHTPRAIHIPPDDSGHRDPSVPRVDCACGDDQQEVCVCGDDQQEACVCHQEDPAAAAAAGASAGAGLPPGEPGHVCGPDCSALPTDGRSTTAPPGVTGPTQGTIGTGIFGIGEVLTGSGSFFLSPEQVADLALAPGSVMHRLITDPVTGRCLERSTTSYPFTTTMKTAIRYADLTCRTPGCLVPGAHCQYDHVTEHGTDNGHTREANGALAHAAHHDKKTKKYLDVVINGQRDMTFRTLLDKIYRSKAHDYTQYAALLATAMNEIDALPTEDQPAAADEALYQALSYRPFTFAHDDHPDTADDFLSWDSLILTHRDPATGRRLNKPDPDAVRAEQDRHHQTRASAAPPASDDSGSDESGGDASGGDVPASNRTLDESAEGTANPTHGLDSNSTNDSTADGGATNDSTADGGATNDSTANEHGPWATPDDTPPPF